MQRKLRFSACLLACFAHLVATGYGAELEGVVATFEEERGAASMRLQAVERFKLRIDIDPGANTESLHLRVKLPITGRNAWPIEDVEVRDSRGEAMIVRRNGIEWHELSIPVPAIPGSYFVQAVEPPGGWPKVSSEKERQIIDPVLGSSLSIARWPQGRKAALSLRFDDSHPTHLSVAIPLLREYGYRGTFMINPGKREPNSRRRSSFEDHQAEWESVARQGDQELANHTAHHRGATSDAEMEAEIEEAAEVIWNLSPEKSKLTALNLGGGTRWETTHTLRHFLQKYHLFDASRNSTGMDDSYGNRVENFRRMLGQHLERGLWFRVHYHYIGENLSTSEANFRSVLDIVKEHEGELWIAGMADIHKYQTERDRSSVTLLGTDEHRFSFRLTCQTDPALYDQPLTMEFAPPRSWPADQVTVTDWEGKPLAIQKAELGGTTLLRFESPPHTAEYAIERTR